MPFKSYRANKCGVSVVTKVKFAPTAYLNAQMLLLLVVVMVLLSGSSSSKCHDA
jgi:hypothetical protein